MRTVPTIDDPNGYEYTPAPQHVHEACMRRFETTRPTAVDPERAGYYLADFGNFWDGAYSVKDNGDGTFTYTSPYTGKTDDFS